MPTNQPIVLLRERTGDRYLPIWIGAAEATAIAFAQQGVVPPRPLTHDLLNNVVEALGRDLRRVRVDELRDRVFYAILELGVPGVPAAAGDEGEHGEQSASSAAGDVVEVSARPSDGIALALRANAQIVVAEEVFDAAGITMAAEEDEEVERFREFLDQISPEDFDTPTAETGE